MSKCFTGSFVRVVSLQVTHTVLVTPTVLDKLSPDGSGGATPFFQAIKRMLLFFKVQN